VIYSLGERTPVLEGSGHFVAENATVIGYVRLQDRASVWFNCVLRGDNECIDIGAGSNVQDGAVLHTDLGFPLTVGRDVTLGHMVMLHGCTIGNNSLVGIGSTILNGATIGDNCLVGAQALVTEGKSFPDGSLILGSPAKVARQLTAEEIAGITQSAQHYVNNATRFSQSLREA